MTSAVTSSRRPLVGINLIEFCDDILIRLEALRFGISIVEKSVAFLACICTLMRAIVDMPSFLPIIVPLFFFDDLAFDFIIFCKDNLTFPSPLSCRVIVRRFGLRGYERSTLEEIGRAIDLTRERVRQIQMDDLSSLRNIMKKHGIKDISFLND